jgi:hypothetical protein
MLSAKRRLFLCPCQQDRRIRPNDEVAYQTVEENLSE